MKACQSNPDSKQTLPAPCRANREEPQVHLHRTASPHFPLRLPRSYAACGPGLLAAAVSALGAGILLLPIQVAADTYLWDNQHLNGIWNDPVNWGLNSDRDYNKVPTLIDTAVFRGPIPAGTVMLTNDGFCSRIRQAYNAQARTITIGTDETVDRTLTFRGTATELFELVPGSANFTLDGAPNGHGARLKLVINGTHTICRVNYGATLAINCDVSGTNGFSLYAAYDGPGKLVLGGTNTYTGPTTVIAGTLLVTGSIAEASAVSVAWGATLSGNGTIAGAVTVAAGGRLSPGVPDPQSRIGTLTLSSNLTLAGDLFIEVDKSLSPTNDMVAVSGALTNAGAGTMTVRNVGGPLSPGDTFQIFNQPLPNGQALTVLSFSGNEVWANNLAVDGSITVLSVTPPAPGDPTAVFTWAGAQNDNQYWETDANWQEGVAPLPGSANILVFQGDIKVPYNWPHVTANYGTTILIFSNNIWLNAIKILGGSNNTVNLGSYVRQDASAQPCYFGIDSPIQISYQETSYWVTNYNFTNALGDASCGSQTDFQCNGGRLDVYGVLKDGAGTSSRLVKSGENTLNITGMKDNIYTGGTIVNEGGIKMQKPPGVNAIPGDVVVNGSARLTINAIGGEQIADTSIVTLNSSASFDMIWDSETVQTIQSTSPNASVYSVGTLTVAPSSSGIYNLGVGESGFSGSITSDYPESTVIMNGTGIYGMLGGNSIKHLIINSGTLKVNGNSGDGTVMVNSGGTLLGKDTIAGAVTVTNGGTIGAGFSIGKLTLSNGLNLSAGGNGATNVWELAALKDGGAGVAGTDYDQIVLTGGALALGSQASLDLRFTGSATAPDSGNPFWQSLHEWTIIALSGGSNPGFSNFGRIKNGSYAAGYFITTATGSGIVLTFIPQSGSPSIPPLITAITNAGAGSVTVSYANTLPGTNYVLSYSTNLGTPNWLPAGTKTASGPSDSQTDSSATNNQRYYRVYYVTP